MQIRLPCPRILNSPIFVAWPARRVDNFGGLNVRVADPHGGLVDEHAGLVEGEEEPLLPAVGAPHRALPVCGLEGLGLEDWLPRDFLEQGADDLGEGATDGGGAVRAEALVLARLAVLLGDVEGRLEVLALELEDEVGVALRALTEGVVERDDDG